MRDPGTAGCARLIKAGGPAGDAGLVSLALLGPVGPCTGGHRYMKRQDGCSDFRLSPAKVKMGPGLVETALAVGAFN